MKSITRKSLVAATAAALVLSAGAVVSPAKADPAFSSVINRFIDHAIDRTERRGYTRGYDRYQRARRHHDYYGYDRQVRRRHLTPDEMELRGLYVPGYDINGVMDYNRSGHRH
ncbi:hypothetical protein [Roseovarius sp.]|jgi:hypothetical protein|uniref:hypothetical protein n=1 Tax=Roseovarius sp. TaxID=1486281 RepID=UPI0026269A2C|nr:hypothetical protein [Roseovarius sp.]MDM8167330.1 hypothetical protein [Roseovarius sp.]